MIPSWCEGIVWGRGVGKNYLARNRSQKWAGYCRVSTKPSRVTEVHNHDKESSGPFQDSKDKSSCQAAYKCVRGLWYTFVPQCTDIYANRSVMSFCILPSEHCDCCDCRCISSAETKSSKNILPSQKHRKFSDTLDPLCIIYKYVVVAMVKYL